MFLTEFISENDVGEGEDFSRPFKL